MAGCAVLGVAIERFAYRPLRDAPRIAPLISALGVSFFLAYSMQLLFGAEQRDYDAFSMSDGALFFEGFDIGNVRVPLLRIIIIVSAFVLMVGAVAARHPDEDRARRCRRRPTTARPRR